MKKTVLAAVWGMIGCVALADTSVVDVVARQRWPWSGVVDIDYTLVGETSDVKYMAMWEGCSEPVDISSHVSGEISLVERGAHHATWDPATVAEGELHGVSVSVVPINGRQERKYLVLDLVTGTYSYLSDVPAGGWTDEYKKTKMPFVRVPAGTYSIGLTQEQMDASWADGGRYASFETYNTLAAKSRQVKVSSDYYMAVFMFTTANSAAVSGNRGTSAVPQYLSTDAIRGGEADACWPQKGHDVSKTSLLGRMRDKYKLPKGWLIDLPTATQFEIAARCGKASFFPNESITQDMSEDDVLAYVNSIAWWKRHQPKDNGFALNTDAPVGALAANEWGLYDIIGFRGQVTLDWNLGTYVRPDYSVDPVGPLYSGDKNRMIRSMDTNPEGTITFAHLLPARGGSFVNQSKTSCFRLCVDTRSLIETTSDVIQ